MEESTLDAPCPMCGARTLTMRSLRLDIPYFGDALQTTVLCAECGFRHADVILTKEGKPTRHTLRVRSSADLTARVVRSGSCTVRLPELKAIMEPGQASEAFVSNAEGVLRRFREVFGFLVRNADTAAQRAKAESALATLDRMIAGLASFTLILDDPFGNSTILHEDAEARPLTARETAGLKTGVLTFETRGKAPRSRASP